MEEACTVGEKYKKTISNFLQEKEKLVTTITSLEKKVTLLNPELENMTKFVCMLNNGSNMLDEILEVRKMFRNVIGIGFYYNSMTKETKVSTKKFVPPEKKTEFLMVDHMPQQTARHMYP